MNNTENQLPLIDECFKRKSVLYSEVNVQSSISNVESAMAETPKTDQRFEPKEITIVPISDC